MSLAEEFALARQSFIVASLDPVGRPGFRSYRGSGLIPDVEGDWAYSQTNQRVPAFGFFLYQQAPLTLGVSGWTSSGESREVSFRLNGQTLGRGAFGKEARLIELEVPAEATEPGMNWVEIEGAKGLIWRDFLVRPGSGAVSQADRRPVVSESNGSDELRLTFGQAVEFALEATGGSQLTLELSSWEEPGASPRPLSTSELKVAVRKEDGAKPVLEQTLTGAGPHRLDLPEGLGRFALSLTAQGHSAERPLPGQLGLRLIGPELLRDRTDAESIAKTVSPTPAEPLVAPPNVILYVIDTLRADRLSLYGYPHPTSPRLAELAKDSVLFRRVTAQSSWTKPTVASILTGLEPSQHGVLDFNDMLERDLVSWPEHLKPLGYQSFAVVANPLVGQYFGFDQGFDRFESLAVTNTAAKLNEQAKVFLKERDSKRPFFLWLQPIDPHLPYNPPAPWREKALKWHGLEKFEPSEQLPNSGVAGFSRLTHYLEHQSSSGKPPALSKELRTAVSALYDGEVASTDSALGQLIDELKAEGLYDNTLIIVTSDHGEEILDRDWLGHLHSFHEELIHIPLVIKFPHSRWGATVAEELWQQVDILPTVLECLGVKSVTPMDGLRFPRERDKAVQREAFSEVQAGSDAREAGQGASDFLEQGHVLRQERWKLVHHDSSIKPNSVRALYDLSTDPGENKNLIFESPVRTLFLEKELSRRALRASAAPAQKASGEPAEAILRSLQYLR